MGMVHCFKDANGELVCIPVYVLVRKLIPEWWWERQGPHPQPWRYLEEVRPELQKELATIVLINELASTLSEGRGEAIKEGLQAALRNVQLPRGQTVELNPQPLPPRVIPRKKANSAKVPPAGKAVNAGLPPVYLGPPLAGVHEL